jgi:hypothetical protein
LPYREGKIANSGVEEKNFLFLFYITAQKTVSFITPKVDSMVFEICNIKWTVHILLKIILHQKHCVITSVIVYKLKDLKFAKFWVKYDDPENVIHLNEVCNASLEWLFRLH